MLIKKGKINIKYLLIVFILAGIVGGGTLWLAITEEFPSDNKAVKIKKPISSVFLGDSQQFRNQCIKFIRETAENYFNEQPTQYPKELEIKGNWEPHLTLYHQGEIKGEGSGKKEVLSLALEEAVKTVLDDERCGNFSEKEIKDVRFSVKFLYPPHQFSFIEYKNPVHSENLEGSAHSGEEGKELIGDLVIIRNLDKELILRKIKEGKDFLCRVMNKNEKGFYNEQGVLTYPPKGGYKKYDTLNDSFEKRLHTVYSASIIYTFLYIYDLEKDKEILEYIPDWGDFLLFMQNKEEGTEGYGGFHYSYYLEDGEKEKKFVVGTAALSIFTLLRLYDLTGQSKYLDSAKLAGDWLTSMQNPDGTIKPHIEYSDGQWSYGQKESLLYEGQVLSALSKLYGATHEEKYCNTAEAIARRFADKYEKENGYIEGEYRKKNPISNAWVVMSLMDFYQMNKAERYKKIIFELSDKILKNQKKDTDDLLYCGGWAGAYSTSGMGWISEVMTETYRFCKKEKMEDCEKYKEAVIMAIRWILQNTYSEENSFFLKNPEMAIGGVFWNEHNKYVRTDSVCHALNGYIRIMDYLEDGLLLSIPEQPFKLILNELKK